MKRLALVVLAGATLIAAQTTDETTTTATETEVTTQHVRGQMGSGDMGQMTDEMKAKLEEAFKNAGEDADVAREAAVEFQKQMREKTGVEADSAMEARRAETHERLQGAIDALDKVSEKVGCQVEEVRARIQSRLQEKRTELIDLQTKIEERKAAMEARRDGSKVKPEVTETEVTEPATEEAAE